MKNENVNDSYKYFEHNELKNLAGCEARLPLFRLMYANQPEALDFFDAILKKRIAEDNNFNNTN